jgi:Rrf2 family protein
MLSLTADYALRAILTLARDANRGAIRSDAIADAIGAPRNYLSKTMHALARAGIVTSARGPLGGFVLAIDPKELSVAQIADVFSEPRPHPKCLLGAGPCDHTAPCVAHLRWSALNGVTRDALSTTSVADLLGATAA